MTQGNVPLSARLKSPTEPLKRMLEDFSVKLRVAMPGTIKSFDAAKQTVTVQLMIREKISLGNQPYQDVAIPIIEDVPIFMPRAGNFVLTMPVTVGDECLVVFGDNCIDSWWESGSLGNQMDRRRHDLSDGFALIGVWSQPKVITDYSIDSAVLRNLSNDSYVEVKDAEINIITTDKVNVEAGSEVNITAGSEINVKAPIVNVECDTHNIDASASSVETAASKSVTATTINLTGSGGIILNGSGASSIDGKNFINHIHKDAENRNTTGVQ